MIKDNDGKNCPWWYGFFPYARPGRDGSVPLAIPREGTENVKLSLMAHPREDDLRRFPVGFIFRLTHTRSGMWMAGKWDEGLEEPMLRRLRWLANNNAKFGVEISRSPVKMRTAEGSEYLSWRLLGATLVHPAKARYPEAWVRPVEIWPELIDVGMERVDLGLMGALMEKEGAA